MKGRLMIAVLAVAIAVLFAVQFRYERFMDMDGAIIVEVDRFTRSVCYVAISIAYDLVGEQILSIPRCGAK